MAESNAKTQTPKGGKRGGAGSLKKIKKRCDEISYEQSQLGYKKVRVLFEDEAGFGRINKPKRCWCPKGKRPSVPCHHIREYRYAFGAVDPKDGASFFLVMPHCNTACMNVFLREVSKMFPDEYIALVADGAAWHKSKGLMIPSNIEIINLPPYTPEMNPIEQIWKELRTRGFRNEVFQTLDKVVDRLCEVIRSLSPQAIQSITARSWILSLC